VLVIVGCEIGGRYGHCVALDIDDCRNLHKLTPPEYLREVKEQGGAAFVAHPKGTVMREFNLHLAGWDCWDDPNYTGLEIWSYMHDWIEDCSLRRLRDYVRHPDEHITGPPPEVLQLWDKLACKRRIVGLGALDNHAANVPLRKLPWHFFKIFPHEFCFRTIRTHVIMPPLGQDAACDVAAFLEAVKSGRCYVDYAPLGDGTGFQFTARHNGSEHLIGDEFAGGGPIDFIVHSPCPAEIILLRNGQAAASTSGTELEHRANGRPGVYRVEARINGRPWLFTNHFYVR
ncbi:MAG: hypothetical protein HQ592_15350, partial [Planctomycetes bacterium]|nr:hypothetical protein [Planctomycetota bacterium]